jgi:hypothetical protein
MTGGDAPATTTAATAAAMAMLNGRTMYRFVRCRGGTLRAKSVPAFSGLTRRLRRGKGGPGINDQGSVISRQQSEEGPMISANIAVRSPITVL